MGLQVRPAPHAAVDDVRQAFPVGHLQPPIQRPGDGHTFAGLSGAAEGLLQVLHGALFLLQLLHQGVHSLFRPFFLLVALLPAQQPLHCRAGEGEQTGHGGHSAGLHQEAGSEALSARSVSGRQLCVCLCMWGGRGVDELSLARPRTGSQGRTQLLVLRAQEGLQ